MHYIVFLQSDTAATIYFAAHFCVATVQEWLPFKSCIYFFGQSTDINNGWICTIDTVMNVRCCQ